MGANATTRPSLAEIDEALTWSSLSANRDDHWQRWIDALLDKRNDITQGGGGTHVCDSI